MSDGSIERIQGKRAPAGALPLGLMNAGGKGKVCDEINARLGDDVGTYAEPFCGSMAVLLSREPARREVVCDTSSLLVNAWRAMAWDPLAMAYWADWPTFHDDLIARRRWLGKWVEENAAKVQEDADYCDPKAGAWWMWAMSHSIRGNADMGLSSRPSLQASPGAGYGVQSQRKVPQSRPELKMYGTAGRGIQAQRSKESIFTRPYLSPKDTGARAVSAQREGTPGYTGGGECETRRMRLDATTPALNGIAAQRGVPQMPGKLGGGGLASRNAGAAHRGIPTFVSGRTGVSGGQGLQTQRGDRWMPGGDYHGRTDAGGLPAPVRWLPWFEALAERLKQVVVLNRGWQSACTPAALAARAGNEVAVLLDPPYVTSGRAKIYEQDTDPDAVNATARESYEWAIEHGDEYRIAYCHTAGSFDFPDTWEILTRKYSGTNQDTRTQDAVAFSPKCHRPGRDTGQLGLGLEV